MIDRTPILDLDGWFAEPGGSLAGRLHLPPAAAPAPGSDRIRGVRVELRRHTEGRGDDEEWVGQPLTFPLSADGSLYQPFRLPVPADAPISYDGSLFRVIWTVRAVVDVRLRADSRHEVAVVVVPSGGLALYTAQRRPHPLTRSASSSW